MKLTKPFFSIILFIFLISLLFTVKGKNSIISPRKIQLYKNPTDIYNCSSRYDRNKVYEFNDLLTKEECNTIIKLAEPKLEKSTVLNEEKYHSGRTSSHIFLEKDHQIIKKIDDIVYSFLEIPIENYEKLQVVNYKPTEKYDAHYDACDKNEEICKNDIMNRGGLRYATFIFYLNDNFTSGETNFPYINFKTKPKTGKGVLFFNLNDDNSDRRKNSFHAGLPPTNGEKWMCNKWIRMEKHQ